MMANGIEYTERESVQTHLANGIFETFKSQIQSDHKSENQMSY